MKPEIVKIAIAARELGISVRVVYNWISEGSLKTVEPGKVVLADAILVHSQKQQARIQLSQDMSNRFTRDERGRFRLLGGTFNGKHRK